MFCSLYLAELPDKTSLATLALLKRRPALFVWIGSALALVVQTVLAVTAGRVLALVPRRPLSWLEIVLFLAFAVWLWKESGEQAAESTDKPHRGVRGNPIIQTFSLVFAAEFLDLTQMATMTFASREPHHLVIIGLVAALALLLANATIILGGRALVNRVPGGWLERIAAVIFALIGIYMGLSQIGLGFP